MTRLLLLRHAKAGWPAPGMRDFDRPLDATGQDEARAIGARMRNNMLSPDLVYCSGAVRARQTLEGLSATLRHGPVLFSDTLYSADAAGYLAIIRESPPADTLLVVGHNPMMEDLLTALPADGDPEALDGAAAGFPPSALAVIRFDGALADAAPGAGFLEAFHLPAAAGG